MESPITVSLAPSPGAFSPGISQSKEPTFSADNKGNWVMARGIIYTAGPFDPTLIRLVIATGNSTSSNVQTITKTISEIRDLTVSASLWECSGGKFQFTYGYAIRPPSPPYIRTEVVELYQGNSLIASNSTDSGAPGLYTNLSSSTDGNAVDGVWRDDFNADGIISYGSYFTSGAEIIDIDVENGFGGVFTNTTWATNNKLYQASSSFNSADGLFTFSGINVANFDRDNLTIITDEDTPTISASVPAVPSLSPFNPLLRVKYYSNE